MLFWLVPPAHFLVAYFVGLRPLILKRHPDRLEEMNQKDDKQADLDRNDERIADECV